MASGAVSKRYDRAYFDRWYRHRAHRVRSAAALLRQVEMALAVCEFILERPVRSVLDVGCGEAAWQPVLARLRPRVHYTGVDPSSYAVRRFGARRNVIHGSATTLDQYVSPDPVDLLVCNDVLHYLAPGDLREGLRQMTRRVGGIAFLAMYTSADEITGDCRGWRRRSPAWYHRSIAKAGLVACGLHCYVTAARSRELDAMLRPLP